MVPQEALQAALAIVSSVINVREFIAQPSFVFMQIVSFYRYTQQQQQHPAL